MDEALIKKVQPHSKEAEQAVIGSMIMDKDAISVAAEILSEEDFYQQQYGVLFTAMTELDAEGKDVDTVTLQAKLKEKDFPQEYSSVDFLKNLIIAVPTSANVKSYAQIVKQKAVARKLIKITEGIANDCYLEKENIENILDKAEKEVFKIAQTQGGKEFVDIKTIVFNTITSIEAVAKNKGSVTGVSSGFIDLDYKTAGFQPSDLILIAARPSMGKTAFVLNLAEYMAVKCHVTTAIFSLEMSTDQLVKRMLAMNSHVDSQSIRTGNLKDEDWVNLIEGARQIGSSNLILDDTASISIKELSSKCRKFKLEHNLGMVIIDYLQLMTGNGKSESRQNEISDISRSLKALARELNVPVIALSQLSRAVEKRDDKRPMLSDLRESGAIEQDADVVMFIYRDEYYNKESKDKGIAEIIIGKQRNGPTGTVQLKWQSELTRFANLEHNPK